MTVNCSDGVAPRGGGGHSGARTALNGEQKLNREKEEKNIEKMNRVPKL